jgi:hypothetical protein
VKKIVRPISIPSIPGSEPEISPVIQSGDGHDEALPQVAEHLGVGVRSVRTVTARMGVQPVGRGVDGNLYDRAAILAAAAKRPGAGARTDLRKDEQA